MARLRTDWLLFMAIVMMVAFGLVMVYSTSSAIAGPRFSVAPYYFVVRQFGWAALSFLVLMQLRRMDYRRMNAPEWAFSGMAIVLGLLVAVYFVDWKEHRWFRVAHVGSFQPSEFAKPALTLFLAYFIGRRSHRINNQQTLKQAMLAVVMLAVLVVAGDLGTALIPMITALILFWIAGLDYRHLARIAAVGVLLVAVAVVARPYRLARIVAFFDPEYKRIEMIDPGGRLKLYLESKTRSQGQNYQAIQSTIAVGSGGVIGLGLMNGPQRLFVPEVHTDFIYATIAEELGLWGAAGVVAGYLLILWRGARLFVLARDDFGKYLALGATLTVVLQALVNISVVLDMGPTKGIPLPLLSFGGSSLLSTMISLGMLLSVSEHEG